MIQKEIPLAMEISKLLHENINQLCENIRKDFKTNLDKAIQNGDTTMYLYIGNSLKVAKEIFNKFDSELSKKGYIVKIGSDIFPIVSVSWE